MSNTTKWVIGVIIVVAIIWFGYSAIKTKEVSSIKIGAILPMTGDLATYGGGIKNAAELAVENSGLKDKIQLVVEDDHSCVPADAVGAAQKLINLDKVNGILGAVCSSAVLSVAPITEKAKLILISPSASSKSVTTAGDYVFRIFPYFSF